MAGRLAIGVAVATCFLLTGSLYAQGVAPPGGMPNVPPNSYAGPAMTGPGMNGPVMNGPANSYGPPMAPAPLGWNGPPSAGPGPSPVLPNPYYDSEGMVNHPAGLQPGDDMGQTPFEEILSKSLRNVEIRFDYLNWTIMRPRQTLIGAQPSIEGIYDPTFPFNRDPRRQIPVDTLGTTQALDTSPLSLDGKSGIKGTLTLPMTYGTAELSGFILGKAESDVNPGFISTGQPPSQTFLDIPLKLDEHPSGLVLLYPNGIAAQFSTFMYGGEFNIVLNPIVPKEYGLVWMPLFGFRYLGIDEKFEINGFNPPGGTAIRSTTINNIFGPQAGCRFEFLTKWFAIGVEPKVMLGANLAASDLTSVDASIGNSSDHSQYTHFAPVGALDVYAKIPIHEHIRVFITYNLLGTGFISRPQEQIDYNTSQLSDGTIVNDMRLDIHNSAFLVQGYSIGVEFNF